MNPPKLQAVQQLLAAGRFAKAVSECTDLLRNTQTHEAFFMRGKAHVLNDDLPAALDDFSAAIELAPNNMTYRVMRGTYLSVADDDHAALLDFEAALAIDPSNLGALNGISLALLAIEDFQQAAASAEKAMNGHPNDPLGYFYHGRAMLGLKQPARAVRSLEAARDLFSTDSEHLTNCLTSLATAQWAASEKAIAIQTISEVIRTEPNSARLLSRCHFYFSSGQPEKALLDAQRALKLHPTALEKQVADQYLSTLRED